MKSRRFKQPLTLLTLLVATFLLPDHPMDPWNILNLQKIAKMLLALAALQIGGTKLSQIFGRTSSAIVLGFLGGLISSTATTAGIARKLKKSTSKDAIPQALLGLLAAILAMLLEGLSLLVVGTNELHLPLLFLFIGPMIACVILIFLQSKNLSPNNDRQESGDFKLLNLIKLCIFIVSILTLSKFLQIHFGKNGISILTFLVSLFEIHGSLIANIQMHESNILNLSHLGELLALSIFASFCSKILLLLFLAGSVFTKKLMPALAILVATLFASWFISHFFLVT